MPDEIQNGQQTTTPAQQTPAPSPQPQSASEMAAQTASAPAPQPTPFSARSFLAKEFGQPDLEKTWENDETALRQLVDVARQTAQYAQKAQLADRYAPHASEFDQWLADKEKRAKEESQKAQSSWWTPPPFDPSWEKAIDPQTGLAKPGFDPTIPQKLAAYREFQRDKINQFTQDPLKMLEPGLKNSLVPILEELLDKKLGGFQAAQAAQSYVQQNSSWLFEKDANGAIKTDHKGERVFSPTGRIFASYVQKAEQLGIRDIAAQQEYAERCTEGDLWRARYEQEKGAQGATTQQTTTTKPGVNRIAGLGNNAQRQAAVGEFPKGTSLKERLMTAAKENGINDDVFKTR